MKRVGFLRGVWSRMGYSGMCEGGWGDTQAKYVNADMVDAVV